MLLAYSNIPTKKVDDILLKVDGDLERYNDLKAIIARLGKKEQSAGTPGQYDGFYGYDSDDDDDYSDSWWESNFGWGQNYYGWDWTDDDWWEYEDYENHEDSGSSSNQLPNLDEITTAKSKGKCKGEG